MGISSALSATGAVPVGVVNPFAGATAPAGWLLCYGQAVSRTQYPILFTTIGTTYGVGDGSTTFAIPDMRGRVVAGEDDMGGTAVNRITSAVSGITGTTLGATGGTQNPPLHQHANTVSGTFASSAHSHTHLSPIGISNGTSVLNPQNAISDGAGSVTDYFDTQFGVSANYLVAISTINTERYKVTSSGPSATSSPTITNVDAGTGTSGNIQPTIILNYIIKAQ
jgi:microcystin-dependent protein